MVGWIKLKLTRLASVSVMTVCLWVGGHLAGQQAASETRLAAENPIGGRLNLTQAREVEDAREAIRRAFMTQQYNRVIQLNDELKARYPAAHLNMYYVTLAQSRLAEERARKSGNQSFRRLETKPTRLPADSPSLTDPENMLTPPTAATPPQADAAPAAPAPSTGEPASPAATPAEPASAPTPELTPETTEGQLIPANPEPAAATPSPSPVSPTPESTPAPTPAGETLAAAVTAQQTPVPSDRQIATLISPTPAPPVVPLPAPEVAAPAPSMDLRRILLVTTLVMAGLALVSVLLFVMRRRPVAEPLEDSAPWTPEAGPVPSAPVQRIAAPEPDFEPGPAKAMPAPVAVDAPTETNIDYDNLFAVTQPPHPVDLEPEAQQAPPSGPEPIELAEDIFSPASVEVHPVADQPHIDDSPFANLFDQPTGPAVVQVGSVASAMPRIEDDDIWHARPATDDKPLNLDDLPSAPQGAPTEVDRDVISFGSDSVHPIIPAPEQEDDWLASLSPKPSSPKEEVDLPAFEDFSRAPERAETQAMPAAPSPAPESPLAPAEAPAIPEFKLPFPPLPFPTDPISEESDVHRPVVGGTVDVGSEITRTSWDESYERTAELSHPGSTSEHPMAPEEAPPVQAFHPDETVTVDLGSAAVPAGEVTQVSLPDEEDVSLTASGLHIHPAAALPAVPEITGPGGDLFDREFRQGVADFNQGNWSGAVHHLSIAAALRPEAQDVKEHLREARRRRKEA